MGRNMPTNAMHVYATQNYVMVISSEKLRAITSYREAMCGWLLKISVAYVTRTLAK
jgi:hypothetical protein